MVSWKATHTADTWLGLRPPHGGKGWLIAKRRREEKRREEKVQEDACSGTAKACRCIDL